ncbi:MAG: hypothetical protein Q9222_005425 [Ikaeria aurantiellina]
MSKDTGPNKRRHILRDTSSEQDGSSSRPIEILDSATNSQRQYEQASKGSISPPPARSKDRRHTNDFAVDSRVGLSSIDRDLRPVDQRVVASPINLSTVQGLSNSCNIDTVSLKDILGDPLIRECWLFNYLFDVDFIM